MKKVIHGLDQKIPIKMWLDDIEDGALNQAKNLANLPFAFKHIAIMPDSHQGYGMPIGGVLATKGVVIPNAVGVDIGCGMTVKRLFLEDIEVNNLRKIMSEIRKAIPVGFNKHKVFQDIDLMPPVSMVSNSPIVDKEWTNALFSLGTLGGGNHFIEIQKGSDNNIWIMVHSGSRNLGKQVADNYNNVAKYFNQRWFSAVPREYDLAFLPIDSDGGIRYLAEMDYCVRYAIANRSLMMDRIIACFEEVLGGIRIDSSSRFDVSHNYVIKENHFGQDVMVHRKGAISAFKNEWGIIPGSQGTKSYIIRGKGNKGSFESCSHGAGRRMGRKEAQKSLNLENEIKNLDNKGILHAIRGVKDLDEAPGAYKDINEVMDNQQDLVSIEVELIPIGVIKG